MDFNLSPAEEAFRQEVRGFIAENLPDTEEAMKGLAMLIAQLSKSKEVASLADAYQLVEKRTRKARDTIEDYLLLHHIPGRCSVCKKLGATG